MFPRWFHRLMVVGYLATIGVTIPHVHPLGDSLRPHVHADWLVGEVGAHAHTHRAHAHPHQHAPETHLPPPSASRPESEHDHDCLFLAVSGIAIPSAKIAPPELTGAVAPSPAGSPTVASLSMTLCAGASTLELAGSAAPHCARFLELRTLRI